MNYASITKCAVALVFSLVVTSVATGALAAKNGAITMSDEHPTLGEPIVVSLGGGAGVELLEITYFPSSEVSITTQHEVEFGGAFTWTPEHAGLVALEYTDTWGQSVAPSVVSVRYAKLPIGALIILGVALASLLGSFAFALARMRGERA